GGQHRHPPQQARAVESRQGAVRSAGSQPTPGRQVPSGLGIADVVVSKVVDLVIDKYVYIPGTAKPAGADFGRILRQFSLADCRISIYHLYTSCLRLIDVFK